MILAPPPTFSYKQEDCYNLPCLATLTSSNTEIRYEIKLKSNQKEKIKTRLMSRRMTNLLLFYICMQVKKEQIKIQHPNTHSARGGGKRWNVVTNPQEWVSKWEQMMILTMHSFGQQCVWRVKCMHPLHFDIWLKGEGNNHQYYREKSVNISRAAHMFASNSKLC